MSIIDRLRWWLWYLGVPGEWLLPAPMTELMRCPQCMGSGEIQYEFLDYLMQTPDTKVVKCDNCNGTGKRSES